MPVHPLKVLQLSPRILTLRAVLVILIDLDPADILQLEPNIHPEYTIQRTHTHQHAHHYIVKQHWLHKHQQHQRAQQR